MRRGDRCIYVRPLNPARLEAIIADRNIQDDLAVWRAHRAWLTHQRGHVIDRRDAQDAPSVSE